MNNNDDDPPPDDDSNDGVYLYTSGDGTNSPPLAVTKARVPSSVTEVGAGAFLMRQQLKAVELNTGLIAIRGHAFYLCSELEAVAIPKTVEKIMNQAFSHCGSLRHLGLPLAGRLEYICDYAFELCSSLLEVTLPPTVLRISSFAFASCVHLKTLQFAPQSRLSIIAEHSFRNCISLQNIAIPSSVERLLSHAFSGCMHLMSFEIAENGQELEIRDSVFQDCEDLRNIYFPERVVSVGQGNFVGCSNLLEAFDKQDEEEDQIPELLRSRFDGLPVHKLCYLQGGLPMEDTLNRLRPAAVKAHERNAPSHDVFGMTPIHILALSANLNVHAFRPLMSLYSLDETDKWGEKANYYLESNLSPGSIDIVKTAIKLRAQEWLKGLGLEKWRRAVANEIEGLQDDNTNIDRHEQIRQRASHIHHIYSKLFFYITKEKMSLLELALWKIKLVEAQGFKTTDSDANQPLKKRIKSNDLTSRRVQDLSSSERTHCRMICGANVVIPNVLPFVASSKAFS